MPEATSVNALDMYCLARGPEMDSLHFRRANDPKNAVCNGQMLAAEDCVASDRHTFCLDCLHRVCRKGPRVALTRSRMMKAVRIAGFRNFKEALERMYLGETSLREALCQMENPS